MASPLDNLPETASTIAVLAVCSSEQDHTSLQEILGQTNWRFFAARDRREAMDFLDHNRIGVVLCECFLPDGKWLDLHEALVLLPSSPSLIVSSDRADSSLWAEVLNSGAYDVVAKPFDRTEVIRIVSLAWLHWREATWDAKKRMNSRPGAPSVTGPDGDR